MFETLEARNPTKSCAFVQKINLEDTISQGNWTKIYPRQISDQYGPQARKKAKHLVLVRKSSGNCLSF